MVQNSASHNPKVIGFGQEFEGKEMNGFEI